METQIVEKKAIFSVKINFWPIFRIIEREKCQQKTYKVPQGTPTLTVEDIRSFLKDLRGWWKHKTLKIRQFFQWRKYFDVFSRFIECDKPQGKIYEGPQGFPTNTVEVTRSFLKQLRAW